MKNPEKWLMDMLEAIETIESYRVSTYEMLLKDEKTQDAIMFNLIIMGEAANQLPTQFQDDHPEIPWSSIVGTRNVIVHGYDQVKLPIIWDIIRNNLRPLKRCLKKLIQ